MTEKEIEKYADYRREMSLASYFIGQKEWDKSIHYSRLPAAQGYPAAVYMRLRALLGARKFEAAIEFASIASAKADTSDKFDFQNTLANPLLILGARSGNMANAYQNLHAISAGTNMNPEIPKWEGQRLQGKTLLLTPAMACLGGHGDSMMFARFIPPLVEQGARIVYQCNPILGRLFFSIPGVQTCSPEARPQADFTAGLLELPHLLGLTHIPHILPFSGRAWPKADGPHRIGIHWGASWVDQHLDRTCALAELLPVSKIPNVALYSLQKGGYASQLFPPPAGMEVHNLAPSFKDFADTANAILKLDAVVTTDNVVANLACMLGRPVFVLVPKDGDFRWGDGQTTPWFPTARTYRQDIAGEWGPPIERLTKDLGAFLQELSDQYARGESIAETPSASIT